MRGNSDYCMIHLIYLKSNIFESEGHPLKLTPRHTRTTFSKQPRFEKKTKCEQACKTERTHADNKMKGQTIRK